MLADEIAGPGAGSVERSAVDQMAADLDLVERVAAGGPPVLRLYCWRGPALSLGRFQPDGDVDADATMIPVGSTRPAATSGASASAPAVG